MKKRPALITVFFALPFFVLNVAAQDFGFGFGSLDDNDSNFGPASPSSAPSVKISGEVGAELKTFFNEMDSQDKIKKIRPGDIFSGSLDFSASGSISDVFINLNLAPVFDGSASPVQIGEAYGRAFLGPVTLEAGLRKLSWGRADGFGPLDLVNPLDYSDLSELSDPQSLKIPRPMIRAVLNTGSFSRLEAVFVPWFKGHSFDTSGRWAPVQMQDRMESLPLIIEDYLTEQVTEQLTQMVLAGQITPAQAALQGQMIGAGIQAALLEYFGGGIDAGNLPAPDTSTLKYAQAGLRFTTTVASTDLGFQYYFGWLPRPAFAGIDLENLLGPGFALNPSAIDPRLVYNYYNHFGVDCAMVIAGFNTRAELGANITSDTDGTDGSVYNPAVVYSLGFDRDLFYGINLNLQGSGSIRLFHDKIEDNLIDIESGSKMTSTRITGVLSRKFMRDELELKATMLFGIEDKDFLVMPALVWSRNEVSAEISAGIFGGDKKGELGQYRDNSYIRTGLTFSF